MDPQLQVLRELSIELFVVFRILGQSVEQLQTLFDNVLADDLQDFALLQHLTGDVQWKILGINDAFHEVEVLGDELFAVFHDEDSSHIQLDVVLHFAILEEVKWRSSRDEKQSTKFELALNGEVLHCEVVLPVIGERFVELAIFLVADVIRVSGPNRLGLVEFLELCVFLLNLLCLLFLSLVFLVTLFLIFNVL